MKHVPIPLDEDLRKLVYSKILKRQKCWKWLGAFNGDGYAVVSFKRKLYRVSRVVYAFENGDPNDFLVRHTCDTPGCCKPEHLIKGTTQDNINDKVSRGRARGAKKGEKHHMAFLTDKQVGEIRNAPTGYGTGRRLAEKYGASPVTISNIRSGVRR